MGNRDAQINFRERAPNASFNKRKAYRSFVDLRLINAYHPFSEVQACGQEKVDHYFS